MAGPLFLEKAAPVMTYGGGTTTVLFSLDWNAIGVIVGILIGICGLILQWYYEHRKFKSASFYKRREDERQQAIHDRHMGMNLEAKADVHAYTEGLDE